MSFRLGVRSPNFFITLKVPSEVKFFVIRFSNVLIRVKNQIQLMESWLQSHLFPLQIPFYFFLVRTLCHKNSLNYKNKHLCSTNPVQVLHARCAAFCVTRMHSLLHGFSSRANLHSSILFIHVLLKNSDKLGWNSTFFYL